MRNLSLRTFYKKLSLTSVGLFYGRRWNLFIFRCMVPKILVRRNNSALIAFVRLDHTNRMKLLLLFLVAFAGSSVVFGQSSDSKRTVVVHGMVKELNTMTPIPNAKITVLRNNQSVQTTVSDSSGMYAINVDVLEGEQLEIQGTANHHEISKNLLIIESTGQEDYSLDVALVYQTVRNAPPRVLFERNKVNHLPFDLTLYHQLLEDNPKICIEIKLYAHPDENEKLTTKRLIQFEKFLISEKFPMNQVDINFEHHERKCLDSTICQAELFFQISSVDGHCLQE